MCFSVIFAAGKSSDLKKMKIHTLNKLTHIVVLLLIMLFGRSDPALAEPDRPNILLIMADDMGYSDLGSYGSRIDTPNLDRMAQNGVRFTNFYNRAKCNPTRASLHTGMFWKKSKFKQRKPLQEMLNSTGYYTAMSGKEHYSGWYPKEWYAKHTFDDSFVYWAINPYFVPPDGKNKGKSFPHPFEYNGQHVDVQKQYSAKPFYKTELVTEYGIRFLNRAKKKNRPFFLNMAYHIPHYPLQALKEDIKKYRGRFSMGWDRLRRIRFERQKEIGIMPSHAELTEPEDNVYPHGGSKEWARYDPWESYAEARQKKLAREMAVYAAMIDRLDQNVGRLMDHLKETGMLENTVVFFLSDNGACPFDNGGYTGHGNPPFGAPGSYTYQRPEWAAAANTPFRYFKQYGHEGGARTPFITYAPGRFKEGTITNQPGHVADLLPTVAELADVDESAPSGGTDVPERDGRSLLPVLHGHSEESPRLLISGHRSDKRMVRYGPWKIVRIKNRPWELYNLSKDPTETNDLSEEKPEKVNELERRFKDWKQAHNVNF